MKKYRIAKMCIMACLVFGIAMLPLNSLKVQAAEIIATVQGTVMQGTTSEVLLLSTKEGKMEIKLNSGTDSKLLTQDKKISVSVSHGSDGYLHAEKITDEIQTPAANNTSSVSTGSAATVTVTGTIGDKTKDDVIYFNTPQGEMQIKLDTTTTISGCPVLIMGKTYSINCVRGSDAYMHAISISAGQTATTAIPTQTYTTPNGSAAKVVMGTVADKTKESLLYLSTNEGEMQFKIDGNADTAKGMVLTPGNKLTVSFYHGSDGYLHAVGIAGVKDASSSADIDTSATWTVNGTVESKSNENILCLNTSGGTMELKLDAVSSVNNCKVLVSGKKLDVTYARGSDAYMHAINITSN